MKNALLQPTRRVFLGQAAGAALSLASLSIPEVSMAASLSATSGPAPQKVRFDVGNSFVVGNIYMPANYRLGERYPAIVIGGSLTAVKEQMGGIYAIEMARRGFITLAIDYRHYGESGGEPRQYENPETKAEDLSAAITYLISRPDVQANRIALLGICTSGGTVLYTAARDRRVAAVASVAGHFAEPSVTPMLYGGAEAVEQRRRVGQAARELYERTRENRLILAYHDTDTAASHVGPMEYYMDRSRGGGVPQWSNSLAVMSWGPWLDFNPIEQAALVTTPALIVHSDGSALPDQARKAHALLKGPKALHWSTGYHFDFYDGAEKVPETAEVIADHFRRYLG